ncbi:hypothetical protein [Algisphaera agarilytica]|uniref:Lipoprotein n=1 Tax=Algisphaera agarilytica TaxID=1385975 RepID=A0A7X0H6G8_9BACT|nr:hypothetical protein [Algisphaera agarilytica]MBB6428695.1 hypothetical protein [Algisphaera agarilytica]
MKTPPRRRWTCLAALLSLPMIMAVPACEQAAVLAEAVSGPEKVEPLYVLPDVPTLVMVDDPKHLLSNPGLARQIATTAIHYLEFHEALPTAQFIKPRELAKLEAELGDRWASTPIDEVGRRLGAEQVIYAKINSAQFHVVDTLYRPEASIEVKIIDVAEGKRSWPEAPALIDPENVPPGHMIQIKDNYESRDSRYVGDSTPDDLARRLADDAGLRLARLFYQWQKDAPGASL